MQDQLIAHSTANDVWIAMKTAYVGSNDQRADALWEQFKLTSMKEGGDFIEFLGCLERLQQESKGMPTPISDNILRGHMVSNLPSEWTPYITGLQSQDAYKEWSWVRGKLLEHWITVQVRTKREIGGTTMSTGMQGKLKKKCHNCGKIGHFKKNCWAEGGGKAGQGPKQKKQEGSANQSQGIVLHTSAVASTRATKDSQPKDVWIMDSAAWPMTGNKLLISEYSNVEPFIIHCAGTETLMAVGKGQVHGTLANGQDITLKDIYYVQGLSKNLLSLPQLDEKGFTSSMKRDR